MFDKGLVFRICKIHNLIIKRQFNLNVDKRFE